MRGNGSGAVSIRPRKAPAKLPAIKEPEPAQLRISRVGTEGDGIAYRSDGTPFYLPFTLPGETVTARPLQPRGDGWHAIAETISDISPGRVEPPCRHFGHCGGCALQHWRDADYRAWKSGLLSSALRQAGFTPPQLLGLRARTAGPTAPDRLRRAPFSWTYHPRITRAPFGRRHRPDRLPCVAPNADGADATASRTAPGSARDPAGRLRHNQPARHGSGSSVAHGFGTNARRPCCPDRVRHHAWPATHFPGSGQ